MKNTFTAFLLLLSFVAITFAQETKQVTNAKVNTTNGVESTNVATYDFTTGSNKFYGGTNGAAQVEAGVWGMIAGDANGSDVVDAADRSDTWNERNLTGYRASDVSLSGVTDANDRSITWNNRNKHSAVPAN